MKDLKRPTVGLKITALICAKDEEQSLPYILPKIPEWVDEILLVDGHSSDRTVETARWICPRIRVLHQPNKGKGDALKYGIEQARGDIIVTMDADGSTDPCEMERFVAPLLRGYDYAKGSRFAKKIPRNMPRHRLLGNWIIIMAFDALFFRGYTDLCSGYNAFWKKAIQGVNLRSSDIFAADEVLFSCRVAKAGLKVVEVGYLDNGRIAGRTKMPSWRHGFKAIKTIVRERLSSGEVLSGSC